MNPVKQVEAASDVYLVEAATIRCVMYLLRFPSVAMLNLFDRVGGHTTEMMMVVGALDAQLYSPRCYVMADTDALSATKATNLELARVWMIK